MSEIIACPYGAKSRWPEHDVRSFRKTAVLGRFHHQEIRDRRFPDFFGASFLLPEAFSAPVTPLCATANWSCSESQAFKLLTSATESAKIPKESFVPFVFFVAKLHFVAALCQVGGRLWCGYPGCAKGREAKGQAGRPHHKPGGVPEKPLRKRKR